MVMKCKYLVFCSAHREVRHVGGEVSPSRSNTVGFPLFMGRLEDKVN
jgi:hypothetical protein